MEKPIPAVSFQKIPVKMTKLLRLTKDIKVYNHTKEKACVILSPTPIMSLSSINIENIGGIGLEKKGEHKCTKSFLSPESYRKFQLENSTVYYTVLFLVNGKWKVHIIDRIINSVYYNIQLLPKHIDESTPIEDVPSI